MNKIKTGIVRLVIRASFLIVTGSAFAAPTLNLPPNPPGPYTGNLTFKSDFSLGSYFSAVFGSPVIPAGFDIVQGVAYKAWCVEFNDDILFTGGPLIFTATNAGPYTFRNTLGTLPLDAQSPNWNAVNWLLNNKGVNNVVDIQEALWFLLNGAYHSNQFIFPVESSVPSAATVALVTAALAHNSFVPTPGQVQGVLVDGGDGLQNNGSDVQSLLIEVPVPPVATGCPATQGFWHKANRWPNSNNAVDGIIYTGATKSITIGGISYTQGQLLALLPSGSLHTGGYVNALSQFIAAVLNLVSGAQHASIDATVSTINTDLTGVTFVTGSGTALDPYVLAPISASLQATLSGFENTLNNYNSAAGLGCTEASGLSLGN
jgi:hypothetical protein